MNATTNFNHRISPNYLSGTYNNTATLFLNPSLSPIMPRFPSQSQIPNLKSEFHPSFQIKNSSISILVPFPHHNMKHPSSINLSLALAFLYVADAAWQNDTLALTQFRLQTDTHGNLLSNWTGADASSAAWLGVECSPYGRVVGLSPPSLNLRGPIDSLSPLLYLRFLDLHENRLNGTVSPLLNCTGRADVESIGPGPMLS